jgi:hypothetical protein
MKYWPKQPIYIPKVGHFQNRLSLTDLATWNPDIITAQGFSSW